LLMNLLNPKAAVLHGTVLPGFVVAGAPMLPQTLTLSAIYVAIATLAHGGIAGLAGAAGGVLDDPRRARIVRRALSLALAAVSF